MVLPALRVLFLFKRETQIRHFPVWCFLPKLPEARAPDLADTTSTPSTVLVQQTRALDPRTRRHDETARTASAAMHLLQRVLWGGVSLMHVAGTGGGVQGTATPYKVQTPPLDTDWTYAVGTNPWPEHPRPQLRRDDWRNLNGLWTFGDAADASPDRPPTTPLPREVLVPSCVESGLSGIQSLNSTHMWFGRAFPVPDAWRGARVLLNFEAVDYEATVFVNGARAGHNVGGYFRFTIDVTEHVRWGADNEL